MEDPMNDNNLQTETTAHYSENITNHRHDEGPVSAEDQAKEVLHKTADTIEDACEKAAREAGRTYDKIAPSAQEAYEKTAHAVNQAYQHTKGYSVKNPEKTIFIALGIGVGIGFLWGSNSRHSRSGRYAKPIVNAVSDVAMEFFR
jgi:ElaB/YqjD/DUF883 family membrane-anchored ribosome-binding protein